MYRVTILADSKDPRGNRLTTFELVFPRIILSQFSKHRMFSFNTSSSRAIPFEKMVKMVQEDPFIPIAWQKPHKGMQGTEYYDHTLKEEVGGLDYTNLPRRWLRARDTAVSMAKTMADEKMNMPVTKQLCNRLLEPFMWHTVLLTGTQFENFFELRCPQYTNAAGGVFKSKKDFLKSWYAKNIGRKPSTDLEWLQINKSQAEIHIQKIAEMMWDAYNESTPEELESGMWHIPYMSKIDSSKLQSVTGKEVTKEMVKISSALAARVSYTTIGSDFDIDHERLLKLHDRLVEDRHLSCFEHTSRVMTDEEYKTFVKGRVPLFDPKGLTAIPLETQGYCANFRGFIPYRYMIEKGEEL